MSQYTENSRALSEEELQELVSSSDAGARNPAGMVGVMLALTAISWSAFQLLLASPLGIKVFPGSVSNNSLLIHLAFALLLVFMAYPAMSRPSRKPVGFLLAHLLTGVATGAFVLALLIGAGVGFDSENYATQPALWIAVILAILPLVPTFLGDEGKPSTLEWAVGAIGAGLIAALIWFSVHQLFLAPFLELFIPDSALMAIAILFSIAAGAVGAFLAFKQGLEKGDFVPIQDWILGFAGVFLALYGFIFYQKVVDAGGLADNVDKWFALAGLFILFEGARRALGPAMALLATVFLMYVFFGSSDVLPDVIRWKGASLKKAMSHMWITSEGVFGIALGVSTRFVFLFVLFGSLLDKAGAGNYFIKMAFGALGHLRGGPAKAAVVGSAATGLISGSSIANVVTTGTFTIPLMKRVGFSSEQAGAVEVASSVNGQIMPPVMGAAAFLMAVYAEIPYTKVVTHAFLPAAISYIALVYIVHLEAVKRNMPTLKALKEVTLARTVIGMLMFFIVFAGLCFSTQYPVDMITYWAPSAAGLILGTAVLAIYVLLLKLAASVPDLEPDDPNAEQVHLPVIADIYKAGLYFLLPIITLVYFLMIEQKSPGISAFWATALLLVILVTQRPLKAMFRGELEMVTAFKDGVVDLFQGLIDGSRNMIGIALATATAGVIVGTVTLTGIGQVMADLVEIMAFGLTYMLASVIDILTVFTDPIGLTSFTGTVAERATEMTGTQLVFILLLVGLLSLILGMGLPTTANYIVVSSLMVGVVVSLGEQSGLFVPLIAVHLFVFYFGIMADVTPPVGLASFAAAAVSGGGAIRTGFIAFFYSLRTVALPFVFIFNTDMLLIDVTVTQGILVAVMSTIAVLVFTAGTMGWWLTKSRVYESFALVGIAFMLFRPDFVMDRIQPPFEEFAPATLTQHLEAADPGDEIRLQVTGQDFDSLEMRKTILRLVIGDEEGGEARFAATGLTLIEIDGAVTLDEPFPSTPFAGKLSKYDFYGDYPVTIVIAKAQAEQLPKELIFIPALALLALLGFLQMLRIRKEQGEMV